MHTIRTTFETNCCHFLIECIV